MLYLLLFALASLVLLLHASVRSDLQVFEEEKNLELIQIYNAANEIVMGKMQSTEERDKVEVAEASHLMGAVGSLLDTRREGRPDETSKTEYALYIQVDAFQKNFGTELISEEELTDKLAVFQKLAQHGIPEIYHERGLEGWYFLKTLLDFWASSWGLFILALLLFTAWSQELEKENIRIIKSMPVSLKRYYSRKFFAVIFFIFGWILFFSVLAFGAGCLLDGAGSLDYPIMTASHETIPLRDFLLISVALNISAVLLVLAVIELLSFVLKNSALTFFFSCIFILLGNVLSKQVFSPFNYYLFALFEGGVVVKNYYPFSYGHVFFVVTTCAGIAGILRKISLTRIEAG